MTTKTDPNQNYTIKEFYIKVKGDKTRCCDNGGKLLHLIDELGWDYQCLTTSGKETYDEIMVMFGVLEEGEHWNEI